MTGGRRPGAYAVVRRGDTILLVFDHLDQAWFLPGGGIERGETAEEALAREVREETGFELTSATPLVEGEQRLLEFAIKEQQFFLAEVDDTEPSPSEHTVEWVPVVEAATRLREELSQRVVGLVTPSLVTDTGPDLPSPVVDEGEPDHLQAVVDSGVLHLVEVGGRPSREAGEQLRVVAANLERGRNLDAWADLLDSTGGDLFLLSELDGGMARSENRYVARELADQLGVEFAFAVEFVELGLGSEKEAARLPEGATNEFGVHGGAVLSRVGLARPAAVRFEFDGSWFGGESPEPRVGGRVAVVAEVGGIVVVAPHLESHSTAAHRARQLADLDDVVTAYADGRPVIIGGDLNTHTLDHIGHGMPSVDELTPERFRDPIPHEPLFAEAASRGYDWAAANTDQPTHRTRHGRGDVHFDWFLTRGLQAHDPEVIAAVDADGAPLSDHEVIAVTVRPPGASRTPA